MYKVKLHKKSQKFLEKINKNDAIRIIRKLEILSKNPLSKNLDIKKLEGCFPDSYRLRVGEIRVIYEIINDLEVIYIHDIDFRGNIY